MPDATFLKISGAKLEVSTLPNSHFPSPFSIETSFWDQMKWLKTI